MCVFLLFCSWIYSSLPASKQMLAVSATYPEFLANALTKYMREPTFVRLNSSDPSLIGVYRYWICYLLGLFMIFWSFLSFSCLLLSYLLYLANRFVLTEDSSL